MPMHLRRLNSVKYLALLAITLLAFSTQGYAGADPRMVVEIAADERGNVPSVQDAIEQALPILWDRVVTDADRASLADNVKGTSFLLRVLPRADVVQVTFNQDRVWQYLDQHQITYLREPLRLRLQLQMLNQSGASMPQTVAALMVDAARIAVERGLVLEETAPALSVNWRWMSAAQVHANVQGSFVAAAYSETITIGSGDPLAQLQAWLRTLLLKIRNAQVEGVDAATATAGEPMVGEQVGGEQVTAEHVGEAVAAPRFEFLLTIEQAAGLPAQIILEDALRQERHVKAVIPAYLGTAGRQYRILLNVAGDSWVADWFRRRGMQASPTPEGWLVQ